MNLVTKMLSFLAALPAEDRVECVLPRRHPMVVVVAAAGSPELLLAVADDVANDGPGKPRRKITLLIKLSFTTMESLPI